MQLGPRAGVVGWAAAARGATIGKGGCNTQVSRLADGRGKGLAVRVPRRATEWVAAWAAAYGARPVLAQPCTGPELAGRSARAAGWKGGPGLISGRRAPRGLALAALARRARGPAPRAGTGSRLGRLD